MNIVHLDGSRALAGHHMVTMLPLNDDSETLPHFISSVRQWIPLSAYQDPLGYRFFNFTPRLYEPMAIRYSTNHVSTVDERRTT